MRPGQKLRDDAETRAARRLCRAASAAYYEIFVRHACRTGRPAVLPELLCPEGAVPATDEFSASELDEAEAFLIRLGVICERRGPQELESDR